MADQSIKMPPVVDETTQFPTISATPGESINIDMSSLQMMNSGGIRLWIRWVVPLTQTHQVRLDRCPMIFLNLSAIVMDVVPDKAVIGSFVLNYLHTDEDSEIRLLFNSKPGVKGFQVPEIVQGKTANDKFEFDGLVSKTFGRFKEPVNFIPSVPMADLPSLGIQIISSK